MNGFLLDTNVPSELTRDRADPNVENWLEQSDDDELFLSAISVGELFKGLTLLPKSRRRAELERWLDSELRPWFAGRVLPVTEAIAKRWGILIGEQQLKGSPVNGIDALIGATAIEHDLFLVTRNVKHFTAMGIPMINPWDSGLH